MNFKEIEFCPKIGKVNTTALSSLLANDLFAGSDKAMELLAIRYEQMKKNCGNVPHDDSHWDVGSIKADKKDKAALLPVRKNRMGDCGALVNQLWDHLNFGHDMPTWMVKCGIKDPKRVMIVSQDPLRTNHKAGTLVLSTPFGFHSADYRNVCCQNPILCRMVERLIEECDACVYLTDCMKFYTSDKFVERNLSQFRQLFDEALRMEMETFAPDVIVTLGNRAAEFCHVKPPRDGYRTQDVDGRRFVASYHTGVHPAPIRKFVSSGSINAYFKLVFDEVCGVLESGGWIKDCVDDIKSSGDDLKQAAEMLNGLFN